MSDKTPRLEFNDNTTWPANADINISCGMDDNLQYLKSLLKAYQDGNIDIRSIHTTSNMVKSGELRAPLLDGSDAKEFFDIRAMETEAKITFRCN